jgi:hypothetical protein
MNEREITGEVDVPLEGVAITYEPPFTSWCSHHFYITSTTPTLHRVYVKTSNDSKNGCFVRIFEKVPPVEVGKDHMGNKLLKEVPPNPIAGKITYRIVGD